MKVLILGLGKSGTTALMSSLAQSLNLPPIMEPKRLFDLDYSSNFVAKKLIDSFNPREESSIYKYDRVILITRDPRDNFISRLLYRPYGLSAFALDRNVLSYISLIKKKIANPESVSVLDLANKLRDISGDETIDWIKINQDKCIRVYKQFKPQIFLYSYEDFINGQNGHLNEYVGCDIDNRIEVANEFRRVSRSRSTGEWKNWFTVDDLEFFDNVFAPFMKEFDYPSEDIPILQKIDPEKSILYIVKIVNEWRTKRRIPAFVLPGKLS